MLPPLANNSTTIQARKPHSRKGLINQNYKTSSRWQKPVQNVQEYKWYDKVANHLRETYNEYYKMNTSAFVFRSADQVNGTKRKIWISKQMLLDGRGRIYQWSINRNYSEQEVLWFHIFCGGYNDDHSVKSLAATQCKGLQSKSHMLCGYVLNIIVDTRQEQVKIALIAQGFS